MFPPVRIHGWPRCFDSAPVGEERGSTVDHSFQKLLIATRLSRASVSVQNWGRLFVGSKPNRIGTIAFHGKSPEAGFWKL